MKNLKSWALASAIASSIFATSAFAVGPSAGDLSGLTPDTGTIISAVVAVVAVGGAIFGVILAIVGFKYVRKMLA